MPTMQSILDSINTTEFQMPHMRLGVELDIGSKLGYWNLNSSLPALASTIKSDDVLWFCSKKTPFSY